MRWIFMKGLPGVGKTSVADSLAHDLNAIVIHKDDINNLVFEKYGANSKSSELVYSLIAYFLPLLISQEIDVVIDCSLSREKNYILFKELSEKCNIEMIVIEIYLDNFNDMEKRLANRTNVPEHRIKSLLDIQKQNLKYEDYKIEKLIRVKNDGELRETTATILNNI